MVENVSYKGLIIMENEYKMTETGKQKLAEELAYLKEEKRTQLLDKVKEARKFCDFAEDVTFKETMEEQVRLEARIESLERILYNAEILEPAKEPSPIITLGSTVTFIELPNGEEETYTIVGKLEADPATAKIAVDSPMAESLLSYTEGDEVTVDTPSGTIRVKIVRVS